MKTEDFLFFFSQVGRLCAKTWEMKKSKFERKFTTSQILKKNFFQRVWFWIEFFTKGVIWKQAAYNVTDFDLKRSECVRFFEENFAS